MELVILIDVAAAIHSLFVVLMRQCLKGQQVGGGGGGGEESGASGGLPTHEIRLFPKGDLRGSKVCLQRVRGKWEPALLWISGVIFSHRWRSAGLCFNGVSRPLSPA